MYDVVVIGGGPAGMAAALEASKTSEKVVIIERLEKLGGILNQCIHNGFGLHYFKEELTGPEYADRFAQQVLNNDRIEVMLNTFVTHIEPNKVTITNEKGNIDLETKSIVLTMGCRERTAGGISLNGTRPVGVYTAGQAQKMINIYGKMPGKKVVILGSGDIGLIMARRMTFEGAKVLMVCEIMDTSSGLNRNIQQCLKDFNIPLKLSHTITRVVGEKRVEGVYVAQVDEKRNPIKETEQFVECDTLILSVGLIPETDLVDFININKITSGAYVDEYRQTSVKGIFSSGNVLHVHDLVDNVTNESLLAGKSASMYANNNLYMENPFEVKSGNGVRYVVPTKAYKNNEKFEAMFRLSARIEKKYICAMQGDNIIAKKYVLAGEGNQMQTLVIDKSKLTSCEAVEICVKEGL